MKETRLYSKADQETGRKGAPGSCSPARPSALSPALLASAVLLVLTLGACEQSVNPILESDRDFSLFGTLDMARDTQYVRLIPIRTSLLPGPTTPLDVVFTSEDLLTQEKILWRDSLVTFANGASGHVFYAPLRIRAGHTYRIEVRPNGSDLVTSVETTVPPEPRATVLQEIISGGFGGAFARGRQQVVWEGVLQRPFRIELWYRFLIAEGTVFRDIRMPYVPANEPTGNGGWQIDLDLTKDRLTLDTLVTVDQTPLVGLGLELTILDAAFVPPGGVFDPEVLVQPGTLSNVDNGLGFIGSVGRFPVEWVLANDSAHRLRYLTLEDVFGASAPAVLARLHREAALGAQHPGHHPGVQ